MKIGNLDLRAFVVCVQEFPEREKFIMNHFKEVGLDGVEVWNGFNASTSGLVTTHTYEADNPNTSYRIGPKPTNCWVSFYALWGALSLLPNDYFLTMEWDAKFDPNWRGRVDAALKIIPPDIDVIFLGSCCTKDRPTRHIAGEVFEVKYPLCGHAMIISKKAVKVFLETQRRIFEPLDIALANRSLQLLKTATILPRPVSQFETYIPI